MATCYRHSGRETGVSCSNCDRPICPDCMTPTPVGMRCPECSSDRTQVRTIQSVKRSDDPRVTYVLMALCVIAFLASGQFGVDTQGTRVFSDLALVGQGIYEGSVIGVAEGQYWRLITGGFLHGGLLHIAFNMYLLYMLGQMLEPAMGSVRFALLYFASLLAGSAGALLLDPNVFTVGASGAVFGLMAATFLEMRARGMDPMAGGILGSIGGLILLNLVFTFVLSNISVGGHIGGLVGGALVALAYQAGDRMRKPAIAYAGAIAVGAVAAAIGIAVAGS